MRKGGTECLVITFCLQNLHTTSLVRLGEEAEGDATRLQEYSVGILDSTGHGGTEGVELVLTHRACRNCITNQYKRERGGEEGKRKQQKDS